MFSSKLYLCWAYKARKMLEIPILEVAYGYCQSKTYHCFPNKSVLIGIRMMSLSITHFVAITNQCTHHRQFVLIIFHEIVVYLNNIFETLFSNAQLHVFGLAYHSL